VPIQYKKDGKPKRKGVGRCVRERTDRAPTGETWEEWLQYNRTELNAFTSAQLIEWLDRKTAEHGAGKLIPPDDILRNEFGEHILPRAEDAVADAIEQQRDKKSATIKAAKLEATQKIRDEMARVTAPLRDLLSLLEAPFLETVNV
jgi:hypothetical protein